MFESVVRVYVKEATHDEVRETSTFFMSLFIWKLNFTRAPREHLFNVIKRIFLSSSFCCLLLKTASEIVSKNKFSNLQVSLE